MEQANISAEQAIFAEIDPEETPHADGRRSRLCGALGALLDVVARIDGLSPRGRVLREWIKLNSGAPLIGGSGEINRLTARLGYTQAHHTIEHVKAISDSPALGAYFRYTPFRRRAQSGGEDARPA